MYNLLSYQKLFAESINKIEDEETSIDDLTEEMLSDIMNKVVEKVENLSQEVYGKPDFKYMYRRLKQEFELELYDLIYETVELKNTVRRLKSYKQFP